MSIGAIIKVSSSTGFRDIKFDSSPVDVESSVSS
jgi:hypothetical protein